MAGPVLNLKLSPQKILEDIVCCFSECDDHDWSDFDGQSLTLKVLETLLSAELFQSRWISF
jgi:hypothetical protein